MLGLGGRHWAGLALVALLAGCGGQPGVAAPPAPTHPAAPVTERHPQSGPGLDGLTLAPDQPTVVVGAELQFIASAGKPPFTFSVEAWSADGGAGPEAGPPVGLIDPATGRYQAGPEPTTDVVSVADANGVVVTTRVFVVPAPEDTTGSSDPGPTGPDEGSSGWIDPGPSQPDPGVDPGTTGSDPGWPAPPPDDGSGTTGDDPGQEVPPFPDDSGTTAGDPSWMPPPQADDPSSTTGSDPGWTSPPPDDGSGTTGGDDGSSTGSDDTSTGGDDGWGSGESAAARRRHPSRRHR